MRASTIEGIVLGTPAVLLGVLTVVLPSLGLPLLVGLLIVWGASIAVLADRRIRQREARSREERSGAHAEHAPREPERAMEGSPMDAGAATPAPPAPTHGARGASDDSPACSPGPHTFRAGQPAILELIAFKGDRVTGTVREKDGHDFSLCIVDRANRARYTENPEGCAKLLRKSKAVSTQVEFRVPETAELPCYLILETRGTTYAREVTVDLHARSTRKRRGSQKVGL
jgi:hypothetical protein